MSAATCMSRREFVSQYARKHGKEVAPMVEYGQYVASPYSTSFFQMAQRTYGKVTVIETPGMSRRPVTSEELGWARQSQYYAAAFVAGDFTGRRLSPFESYGTVWDILTYECGTHVRHPDITCLQGKRAMVFDSFRRLSHSIHYLAHWCMPRVSTAIVSQLPPTVTAETTVTVPLGDLKEVIEDDLHTGSEVSKSLRQCLVEYYQNDSRAKTLEELQLDFPTHSRTEMIQILMYISDAYPILPLNEEGMDYSPERVNWIITEDDYPFPCDDGVGLASYSSAKRLKADVVLGELSFRDDEEAEVVFQENFLLALGCEKVSQVASGDQIIRQYRLPILL